ncbi:MAG: hypothetical protein R2680_11320 [Nitrososphaeraceae archaeon]
MRVETSEMGESIFFSDISAVYANDDGISAILDKSTAIKNIE